MTYAAKRTQFKLAFITFFTLFAFIAFVFVEPFIQFAFVFVESLIQLIVGSLVIFPRPESAFILELEQQTGSFPQPVIFRPVKTGPFSCTETHASESAHRLQAGGWQKFIMGVRTQA